MSCFRRTHSCTLVCSHPFLRLVQRWGTEGPVVMIDIGPKRWLPDIEVTSGAALAGWRNLKDCSVFVVGHSRPSQGSGP